VAWEELHEASRLAPDDADIRTNLGLVLVRLGRIPKEWINFTKRYG
jgi:Flp pilus assembly protein TadD